MEQTPISSSSEREPSSWRGKARARVRRASQAIAVLGRFGFDWVLHELEILPRPRTSRLHAAVSRLEMPERLRQALEELGPTAIKLGQVLASRGDIISEMYVKELRELHDHVPPMSTAEVKQVIREELGAEVEDLFAEFEEEPRAAASIGQVHFARLHDGSPVAVKVQRLEVQESIDTDLDIILWAARQAERSIPWAAENRIHDFAQGFAQTLRQELDFQIEGHNTDRLKQNLAADPEAYVPTVHWGLSTRRVLVVEWVNGAKVNEPEQLHKYGVDRPLAAKNLAAALIRQIMRDGYFHGDPHAGNVLFLGEGRVAWLDCGNCLAIDRAVRDNLMALLVAALNDDAQEVTDYLLLLGAVSERTNVRDLTTDIGRMLSYYAGYQSSAEVGLGRLLDNLLMMVLRHGVRVQSSLAAIAKSLVVVEGICLQLDPDFDSQALVRQEVQGLMLERMQGGGIRMRVFHENIDRPLHRLDLMTNRIAFALVVSAIIVSSTNLLTNSAGAGPIGRWMMDVYVLVGLVLGGWLLFSILRSGRL